MENISELVWLYVKRRPFLKEVLKEGIVNYSALARKISIELFNDGSHENAIKMSLIRLSRRMDETESELEEKILSILKKSSMVIRNKVAVVLASKPLEGIKPISQVKSGRHLTYIVDQRDIDPKKHHGEIRENLNLIIIESPKNVEEVPGVISFVLGALASEGINVVEFISCSTDTLLVVKQSDTQEAYRILSTIIS